MQAKIRTPQRKAVFEVWTLTGTLQHLDYFILQLFCCRFAGLLVVIVLLHNTVLASFSCWIDGMTLDSRILWYMGGSWLTQ